VVEQRDIDCPWCGVRQTRLLELPEADVAAGSGGLAWVEDCEVCCQPIVFRLLAGTGGGPLQLATERENG